MIQVEHLLSAGSKLGEGPVWHPGEKAIYWVDIERGCFHRYFPENGNQDTFQVGQPVGCLVLRASGGLVLGLRDGLGSWDSEREKATMLADPERGRENARFNDGKVDRAGRFWAGTLGEDDRSCLYRLDPDHSLHTMETGITISNGIDWSPDDKTMYYTDSARRVIYAYDFDLASGEITNRRVFVRVPETEGFPDGLTVDSQGFVWSAQWDGWRITRYDPEGKVEREVYLPVQRPTSCTFGGEDLTWLFITSAWTGLTGNNRDEQPLAGDIFLIHTEIIGQPVNLFLG